MTDLGSILRLEQNGVQVNSLAELALEDGAAMEALEGVEGVDMMTSYVSFEALYTTVRWLSYKLTEASDPCIDQGTPAATLRFPDASEILDVSLDFVDVPVAGVVDIGAYEAVS